MRALFERTTRLVAAAATCVASLSSAGLAGGGPAWDINGPAGANLQAIAIAPSAPQVLYAGTLGTFRSDDFSERWVATVIDSATRAIAVDPTDHHIVYVATADGVWRSTDGGESGAVVNNGLVSVSSFSIAVDPFNPKVVLVGSTAGISKSTNGADTWVPSNVGLSPGVYRAIAFDPGTAGRVLAGSDRVWVSTDGGDTWAESTSGLSGVEVHTLVFDEASPLRVYAGLGSSLDVSDDGGATWTRMDDGIEHSGGVRAIVIDPGDPDTVWAAVANQGIFRTTDAAVSWSRRDQGLRNVFVTGLVIDPAEGDLLVAATNGRGIFTTDDGGASWSPAPAGLDQPAMRGIAIAPSDQNVIYAAWEGGVDVSRDGGDSWSDVTPAIVVPRTNAVAVHPTDPATAIAGVERPQGGFYRTTDFGSSWTPVNGALGDDHSGAAVAFDPDQPSTVYTARNGLGVYRSTDGGDSWELANDGITNTSFSRLAIDPVDPQTLYAATNAGIFKSTDGAASWEQRSSGLATLAERATRDVAIDPTDGDTVYIATRGGVFKTANGGDSWQRLESVGLTETVFLSVALDPSTPNAVFAGSERGGVFLSRDGGNNWSTISVRNGSDRIVDLAVLPASSSLVYAAMVGSGVARLLVENTGPPVTPTNTAPTDPTPTSTAPESDTPTPSRTPTSPPVTPDTPAATRTAAPACRGDCNRDGEVRVNEIVVGINISLGRAEISSCAAMDADGDGQIRVNELIGAVSSLLGGCT